MTFITAAREEAAAAKEQLRQNPACSPWPRARIVGVVVAYHPDLGLLRRLLAALQPQVAHVVVVDNTPRPVGETLGGLPAGVELISHGCNMGLAAALNRGCERAWQRGADFALLFDQDSLPADDMVARLASAWVLAEAAGLRVAAAGPRFVDDRGAPVLPFARIGGLRLHAVRPAPGCEYVLTELLITSGCLLAKEAMLHAGPMDESFFIDNVDIEWGFRAQARGWALIGVPGALLQHRIGDSHEPAPAWARLAGKHRVIRHAPVRLYYITRNRIRLYWMRHVPLAWKTQDLLRLPGKLLLSIWMAGDRRGTAQALAQGVIDGLAGRGGVKPPDRPAPARRGSKDAG